MKIKNKLYNKFAAIILMIACLITSLSCAGGMGGTGTAYAAGITTTSSTNFDDTDVLEDLKSDESFNILLYPFDSSGVILHPEIQKVVEYCYSYRAAQRGNYGLYIYFYNPQALNISTSSAANKITLGVGYETDSAGNTKVTSYEKFSLKFCSKSTGDYANLFYKFKVIDHASDIDGKTIAERVNSNERRYDISEVELLTVDNVNATAYGVGGSYKFTGYAAGYGPDENAESTLACSREDLETVTIDLSGATDGFDKRTYWRSESSSLGKYHQNQINSVYFAIDESVFEKYGGVLQKIKAEWWEYKTAPAVVVENSEVYNVLKEYVGQNIGTHDESISYSIVSTKDYTHFNDDPNYYYTFYYSWNHETGSIKDDGLIPGLTTIYNNYYSEYIDSLLPILFYAEGLDVNDYTLTAKQLSEYFANYKKSYVKGKIEFNEHSYSADLFSNSVDDGRTMGYNLREFDISNKDDYINLSNYDSSNSWLQRFIDYGFYPPNTSEDYSDICPIQEVTDALVASDKISDLLKINKDDVENFKAYYKLSKANNRRVFVFHFAYTDYFAATAKVEGKTNSDAEVRYGTQFFDFDIISFTFNKDGVYTTLGVVSSPVDIWNSYTPAILGGSGCNDVDWLSLFITIAIALFIIIVLIALGPDLILAILKLVFNVVSFIVMLPVKAISAIVRRCREASDKRRTRKKAERAVKKQEREKERATQKEAKRAKRKAERQKKREERQKRRENKKKAVNKETNVKTNGKQKKRQASRKTKNKRKNTQKQTGKRKRRDKK